jgi:hypothetical protein
VNRFSQYGLGFHAGEWLTLAMVILLALVPGIALSNFVFRFLTRGRDKDASEDASEKDYWRMHGG